MAALVADVVGLALYRGALVRRGMRAPFQDVVGEATENSSSMFRVNGREFDLWMRDLFRRQSDRRLEITRLVCLALLALTLIAAAWWAIA
jgi:hypothetical protein